MAAVTFAPTLTCRISLAEINAAVSARLGPTRIPGNAQPACFNRQIAMYLARHVGRWSTTVIGRFYNGRDHSTVCHSIQRIETLRETDPDVDGLITDLRRELSRRDADPMPARSCGGQSASLNRPTEISIDELAELVAERVCAYLGLRIGQLDRLPEAMERTNDDKDLQIRA